MNIKKITTDKFKNNSTTMVGKEFMWPIVPVMQLSNSDLKFFLFLPINFLDNLLNTKEREIFVAWSIVYMEVKLLALNVKFLSIIWLLNQ